MESLFNKICWPEWLKSPTWTECNMRQYDKRCNMKGVQHVKRCNMKTGQHERRCHMKRVQHEKCAMRKKCNTEKCNTKWVQHKKVQHDVNATWSNTRKGATGEGCNTQKSATWTWYDTKKVQPEKSAIWKSATRIKPNTKWVHYKKKWDMMRVQHKATREKVQHEKSARVKYGKKVHKNSALEWTNG